MPFDLRSPITAAVLVSSVLMTGCMHGPWNSMPASTPPAPPGVVTSSLVPDYAAKPGSYAAQPPDEPYAPETAWPEEFAIPVRRPSLGVTGGGFVFDGGLHLDPGPCVAPRVSIPLTERLELELPVKIVFTTASIDTLVVQTQPPVNNQPPVVVTTRLRSHREGEVVNAELGLVRRLGDADSGTFPAGGSIGAGLGATWFAGFGAADDTALSMHVSGALDLVRGERHRVFLEVQLHGFVTDFGSPGDRSLKLGLGALLGASWDL